MRERRAGRYKRAHTIFSKALKLHENCGVETTILMHDKDDLNTYHLYTTEKSELLEVLASYVDILQQNIAEFERNGVTEEQKCRQGAKPGTCYILKEPPFNASFRMRGAKDEDVKRPRSQNPRHKSAPTYSKIIQRDPMVATDVESNDTTSSTRKKPKKRQRDDKRNALFVGDAAYTVAHAAPAAMPAPVTDSFSESDLDLDFDDDFFGEQAGDGVSCAENEVTSTTPLVSTVASAQHDNKCAVEKPKKRHQIQMKLTLQTSGGGIVMRQTAAPLHLDESVHPRLAFAPALLKNVPKKRKKVHQDSGEFSGSNSLGGCAAPREAVCGSYPTDLGQTTGVGEEGGGSSKENSENVCSQTAYKKEIPTFSQGLSSSENTMQRVAVCVCQGRNMVA